MTLCLGILIALSHSAGWYVCDKETVGHGSVDALLLARLLFHLLFVDQIAATPIRVLDLVPHAVHVAWYVTNCTTFVHRIGKTAEQTLADVREERRGEDCDQNDDTHLSRKLEKVVYVGSRIFLPPIVTFSVSKVRPFLGVCLSQTTVALRILNRFTIGPTILSKILCTPQRIGTNTTRSDHGEGPKIAKMTLSKNNKSLSAIFVGFLMENIVDLVTGRKRVLSSFERVWQFSDPELNNSPNMASKGREV